jgi:hypothetical protein
MTIPPTGAQVVLPLGECVVSGGVAFEATRIGAGPGATDRTTARLWGR